MTQPTQGSDMELREQLRQSFSEFDRYPHKLDVAMQLIQADKQRSIDRAVAEARLDEFDRHFIPHGNNQLETVFRLPDRRISVWGTSDSRAAYEYRRAELEQQLSPTTTEGEKK